MKTNIFSTSKLIVLALPLLLLTACKKAPTADFTFEVDGSEVVFTFSGEGDVTTYDWDFGDGNISSETNPTHSYSSGGDFGVTLTVTNEDGDDSKSKTVTIEASSGSSANPELSLGDADGAFYAINTNTVQTTAGFEIVLKIGTSVAWFQDGGGFVEAGDVEWHQGSNSEMLDFNAAASTYSWVEIEQPSDGFNNNGISYTMTGGNGFSSIGGTGLANLYPFPGSEKVGESNETVDGDAAYNLAHDGSISNADSIYFSIYGPDNSVLKRLGGTETQASFTEDEMNSLGKGSAILQIAAFNITSDESTGKKFYMVNESVASKTVIID